MESETPAGDGCTSCGGPVSAAGRRSPNGTRYCAKRRCRNAKDRANYALRNGGVPVEDRPCTHCGAELPARPRRESDSELGRWCRSKSACQTHKRNYPALLAKLRDQYALKVDNHRRFFAAERVDCPRCERLNAPVGFEHPLPDGSGDCSELGKDRVFKFRIARPADMDPCDCPSCLRNPDPTG